MTFSMFQLPSLHGPRSDHACVHLHRGPARGTSARSRAPLHEGVLAHARLPLHANEIHTLLPLPAQQARRLRIERPRANDMPNSKHEACALRAWYMRASSHQHVRWTCPMNRIRFCSWTSGSRPSGTCQCTTHGASASVPGGDADRIVRIDRRSHAARGQAWRVHGQGGARRRAWSVADAS